MFDARDPVTAASPNTRGILAPAEALAHVEMSGTLPCAELAPFVERLFVARWELPTTIVQDLLLCPCAYWMFGTFAPGVYGVTTRRLRVEFQGGGWVAGVRFRPAGLRGFYGGPMTALRDRVVDAGEIFGRGALALRRAVTSGADEQLAQIQSYLLSRTPKRTASAALVDRAVDVVRAPAGPTTVGDLAEAMGVSVRVLEMRFRRELGLGPKAVVRRCRAIELSEAIAREHQVAWAELAARWGFADQSHMIRDFKSQIGATPARFAERCAAGPERRP